MTENWTGRILLAGVLLLLDYLLYPILGLAPLFLTALVLWFPFRQGAEGRAILIVIVLLLAAWILHQVRWVVYPLLAAMLVAYWLDPLVDRLEISRVPRALAAALALLPIALFLTLAAFVLIPTLFNQLQEIVVAIPEAIAAIQEQLEPWRTRFEMRTGQSPDWLQKGLEHVGSLLNAMLTGVSGLGKGVGKVLQVLGMLLLIPVFAFYLLVDWDRIRDGLVGLVPPRYRGGAQKISDDIQVVLPRYLRGQIVIAAVEVVLFSIGFFLAGLPNAIALGFLGGAFSLLPVVGIWITVLVVALTALIQADALDVLWKVGMVLLILQFLEGQVLTPRVQGSGLGLHPLAVLLAVLCGGLLFGFAGVLLAVPALAVAKASHPHLMEVYRGSRLYLGGGGG